MQQVTSSRRDPAPTRLAYRLNRLWLTPYVRRLLWLGLPVGAVAGLVLWAVADEGRRDVVLGAYHDARRAVEERPEFSVRLMVIDNASAEVADDIRDVLPLDFPVSSFDLDLVEMRRIVAGLDAVERAELRIRSGGILQVSVTERTPAIVWRSRQGLELLDAGGHRVASLQARTDRPDLPLIAGEGAERRTDEALHLIAAAGPLQGRLRGLRRVGERRWDIILDRGQRILLPEENPVPALERVIALAQAEDLLGRDVAVVDMRNVARPTLQLSNNAIGELRRIRKIEAGVISQ